MLIISHSIFLNQEERYKLADGEEVQTTGVSVPVWYQRGNTSEPAVEVFCEYQLLNTGEEISLVRAKGGGYKINLPQLPQDYQPPKKLSDKEWRDMDADPIKKNVYYEELSKIPKTGVALKDYIDGGSKYLKFHHHNKFKQGKKMIDVSHVVEIQDYSALEKSLTI